MRGIKHLCGYVEVPMLLTLENYLGSELASVDENTKTNARTLLRLVNSLLAELGIEKATQTSGFRTPQHNVAIGGAPNSNHCKGLAIDLADNDRSLGNRLMADPKPLISRGMAIEDLAYCVTSRGTKWVHLQSVLPRSGKWCFIPYAGPIVIR